MENLLSLFCILAKIPSPSLQEEAISSKIMDIFKDIRVNAHKDNFGNIIATIPATAPTKPSLLLSAHMDVIGDNSPINIADNGTFLSTDGTRTLGADDKAGVASAIWLAKEIAQSTNLSHGGLEIVFTRDEEQGMSGIKHLDFSKLNSEYVLVLDSDTLGNLEISGASYTKMELSVTTPKGGHSGIDIADESRLNAVKLIAELINNIPQGVVKKDETGVITSINIGAIAGGGIKNMNFTTQGDSFIDELTQNAMDNVINTYARAQYSIRSASNKEEKKLIEKIQKTVDSFNEKYNQNALAKITFTEHLQAFEKSNDTKIIEIIKKSGELTNINIKVSSFHAGAETHIYAHNKNAKNKPLKPYLLGIANITGMHSKLEKLDKNSLNKGYELLKQTFYEFNEM